MRIGSKLAYVSLIGVASVIAIAPATAQTSRKNGAAPMAVNDRSDTAQIDPALASTTKTGTAQPGRAQDDPTLNGATATGGDIVVTAQKRSEILRDVPISISVVTGEALQRQGASSLADYSAYVPGFQVTSGGSPGQATVTLRGVATLTGTQTVGIYVDDAPVGSSGIWARSGLFSLDLLPYDVQQIEVLRGPQGTLYGASSIGGLLKYTTTTPDTHRFGVRGGGEVFGIDRAGRAGWAGQAMVNIPLISDQLAATGSFAYRRTPGYIDVPALGQRDQNSFDQYGGRVSLEWKPNDRFSARLSGIWQDVNSDGNAIIAANLNGRRIGNGWSNNNFYPEPFRKSFDFYSASLNYDLGFATLTSVTSYSKSRTRQVQDATNALGLIIPQYGLPPAVTPFRLGLDLKKVTQEVRLTSSSSDRFEWVLGGFYTHENSRNTQLVNAYDFATGNSIPDVDPLADISLPTRYREYAAFANATFHFNSMFALTGGLRWAKNTQRFNPTVSGPLADAEANPGNVKEDVVTYSISPQIHLTDQAMLYGRIATGYRPGGPNIVFPLVPPFVRSDRLTNYEIGLKADLLDRLLSIDVAGFYMDWKDIQVSGSTGTSSYATNAGTAVSKGVEGSLYVRPITGLTLAATGSYTDARLTADTPALVGGLDGDRLPNTPKFSGSLGVDYQAPISESATGSAALELRRTGKRYSLVESAPDALPVSGYTALDANASVTVDDRWTVRLYARNLTNRYGENNRQYVRDDTNTRAFIAIIPIQPRTIGLALEARY